MSGSESEYVEPSSRADGSAMAPIDSFHRQMKAMAALSIPFESGLGGRGSGFGGDLDRELDGVRAALAVRVELGQPLQEAIAAERTLPDAYRRAASAWVSRGVSSELLDSVSRDESVDGELVRAVRLGMFQLATILVLGVVGLALASWWLGPRVEAMYRAFRMRPTLAATWLSAIGNWIPVWGSVAAAIAMVIGAAWTMSREAWPVRIAGALGRTKRGQKRLAWATAAEQVAAELEQGRPLDEAMTSYGLADPPPLIRWAIYGDVGGDSRAATLRSAAEVYRSKTRREVLPWVRLAPMLVTVALGGGATLLYGMAVFTPVIGLLRDLAMPDAGPFRDGF